MELIYRKMPLDYTVIDTSCWHSGALNCHKDGIRELVEKVATRKNYFMMHKGDWIECILPGDKRYASCSIDPMALTPRAQTDWVIDTIRPIRDKVLAVGLGNHEYAVINTDNFAYQIAKELDIPYGSVMYKFCALDKNGNLMHKLFSCHGRGGLPKGAKDPIQREANRKAHLRRKLEAMGHSDCVYMSMAHDHSALFFVPPTIDGELHMVDDGNHIKHHRRIRAPQNAQYIPPESRWYGIAGSMLKSICPPGSGAISYAEMAMYPPAELGWLELHIEGGELVAMEKVTI